MLYLAFPVEASQLEIQRVEHLRLLLGGNSLTLCSPGCSRDCCHPSGNTQLCWNVGCTGPPGCRCLHTTQERKNRNFRFVQSEPSLQSCHILPLVGNGGFL